MTTAVKNTTTGAGDPAAAQRLARLAHLSVEEVGAVVLLELHAAGMAVELGSLDQASLSHISRLGSAWFRRPAGAAASRGERVMAAIGVAIPAPAAALPAAAPASRGGGLSAAQRAQRRHAANSRWALIQGGGQEQIEFPVDGESIAVVRSAPVTVVPSPSTSPPASAAPPAARVAGIRPDIDEIPDEKAIDYIRGWLWQYAGCKVEPPDDGTCRNVLRAAPGRTLCEIYGALNELWKRKAPPGRSWGWYVAVIRNGFSGAGPARQVYGSTAAVAG